jgi:hypothetical protein
VAKGAGDFDRRFGSGSWHGASRFWGGCSECLDRIFLIVLEKQASGFTVERKRL